MTELLTRYGPFFLGAIAAAILARYTLRSSGGSSAGRTALLFVVAGAVFIAADILTGQALTRPELSVIGVAALALFGLAVIVVIAVLTSRSRARS